MRQAIWFVHDRPREGVLRFVSVREMEAGVCVDGGGTSPQPVKKRC